MPNLIPKKVVYLFGAGATHAELELDSELLEQKQQGLLISNVSDRVIEKARRDTRYLKDLEMVSAVSGSLNIELLISLIENSRIHRWQEKTRRLKDLIKKDIKGVLTPSRIKPFYLHKGLLELHGHDGMKAREKIIGLISLNYDDVLDKAYRAVLRTHPNYCFSLDTSLPSSKNLPLLKLHGSFNWNNRKIRGRGRTIEIIPFGSSKNFLHSPYSFIWNRSLETLIECDVLRVVGCSLSPNDGHLIDLLFRAHLEKGNAFHIEIIDREEAGENIQKNYGFFPDIKRLTEIEGNLIPDPSPVNPFRTWLKHKGLRVLKESISNTRHLKAVLT